MPGQETTLLRAIGVPEVELQNERRAEQQRERGRKLHPGRFAADQRPLRRISGSRSGHRTNRDHDQEWHPAPGEGYRGRFTRPKDSTWPVTKLPRLHSLGPRATPGALAALEASGEAPFGYLVRHINGDWGEVDEHDRCENELSLGEGFRLQSAYSVPVAPV